MAGPYFKQPVLEFQQLGGGCNPSKEDQATISAGPGEINFRGAIITPIPCVSLEAKLQKTDAKLTVIITSTMLTGPCVDCIGRVEYSGKIKLKPGTYTIEILHNDSPIITQEVIVGSK
jgi:hypothetical protein